ncbi:MAG: class I SAM-dependent methyltransferase [Gammaproteobacteria bacterium]
MTLLSTPEGLTLNLLEGDQPKTLRIDFADPHLQFRIKRARHQGDPLLKAFGLKPIHPAHIVDATAGLGQDAFVLAALGHTITLFEKHPNIHSLLVDALQRAEQKADLLDIVRRITLYSGDACEGLSKLNFKPEYIYLDPMFPEKKKSALSKQSMEILKQICDLSEQPELLTAARQFALKRVVVKRPIHAPALGDQTASFSHRYQSCRFDVYVITP